MPDRSPDALPRPAAGAYERALLARHARGELSLEGVADLLAAGIYQLLYRSRATPRLGSAALQRLLEQAQAGNARRGVTGVLLCRDGAYLQVLEGPEAEVRALHARIARDPRHAQLLTLAQGLAPARLFPGWFMAFGRRDHPALAQLLTPSPGPPPGVRGDVEVPLRRALQEVFSDGSGARFVNRVP